VEFSSYGTFLIPGLTKRKNPINSCKVCPCIKNKKIKAAQGSSQTEGGGLRQGIGQRRMK
jgi:hypothetical protein